MPSYCYMKGYVLSSISHANVDYGDCFFLKKFMAWESDWQLIT